MDGLFLDNWLLPGDEDSVEALEETETANADLDDDALKASVQQSKGKNMAKKNRSELNAWKRWCKTVNEQRELHDLPSDALNRLLSHFFKSVTKRNGQN